MTAISSLRTLLLQTALSGAFAGATLAQSVLPAVGPMPGMRPADSGGLAIDPARFGETAATANPVLARPAAPVAAAADASAFTASIAAMGARVAPLAAARGSLKDALEASYNDVGRARAIREGMAPGSLDRQILTWAIAVKGGPSVPFADLARAASELRGWPGQAALRANLERALYRENLGAAQVIGAFGNGRPTTAEGAMALARAYLEGGQAGKAKALVVSFWRVERLDKSTEAQMLRTFGSLLTRADHKFRMDKLLYDDRVSDAARVASLAGAQALFKARAASIRGEGAAAKLLAAVPDQSDPSVLFTRIENLRKKDRVAEAAALLAKTPRDAATLVDPNAWWDERRVISRDLLDQGLARDAYRVVSVHSATGATEAAEAEFHAGWYALRYLDDPRTAAKHFAQIAQVSTKPLSQSRSFYWLGRAAEAGGPGNAGAYYAKAAGYGATFYGQLAAAKLRRSPDGMSFPKPSGAERQRFESRAAVRAIRRLEDIGSEWRADLLYKALAEDLTSPGELALLSGMAARRGAHSLALTVGKTAYAHGVDAPALAFPTGVIPQSANISASGKALAYAIARQESAFNPKAKSPVGALGLLQVMPATAKGLARKAGLPYSESRLLNDVSYNALLGSRYLGEQISNFDGSYVLTFAAYNAGPRRAREWVQRFGDPRGKSVDEVVDWVERIPFTETRNYVQRVMENYQVYKMRLGAGFDIEQDLRFGRQG